MSARYARLPSTPSTPSVAAAARFTDSSPLFRKYLMRKSNVAWFCSPPILASAIIDARM
jgi:hypothetical protein